MPNTEAQYEVLVGSGDRWTIDTIHAAKTVAMARAQALLTSNQHDAVRVTREVGGYNEAVIFQQECAPKPKKPITISSIDDAFVCEGLLDLTAYGARKTTGRVLRKYLDEYGMTALEVLHNHDHLRELRRTERLFDQAIHKVASVQSRALGETAQSRIDTLYRLATQLVDWTRDALSTERFLTIVNRDGLTSALRAIGTSYSEDARPFYICAVLASYFGQARDWRAKLSLAFDLLEKRADAEACVYLDEVCAEILDGSSAMMEILGPQPDLVSALRSMAQLSAGQFRTSKRGDALLVRFNKLMVHFALPETQAVLLERVAQAMSGTNPLTRQDDDADKAAFPPLLKDLISFGGLQGGTAISEAVTRRARIVMRTADRDLSPEEAIAYILTMLPSPAVKLGYLLDLSRSGFGIKHQSPVLLKLLDIVKPINSLSELLPSGSSREELAKAVDDLRFRVGDDVLGQEIGALITKKLETILDVKHRPKPKSDTKATIKPADPNAAEIQSNRIFLVGGVIFHENDPGDEAFMILSGEVQISVGTGKHKAVIATLGRGDIVGEMALIDDQPRMATATALKETRLYVVPQEAFKKRLSWLAEEDRLISHIIETLVSRLRDQFVNN